MLIAPIPPHGHAAHDLRSAYVEQVWLPVLGPTSVALLRACPLLWAIAAPYEADDQDIAHMLGLGGGSRLRDVCKRLARFRVANWDPTTGSLQVRTHLPDLTATQLARCPEHTRGLHCNLASSGGRS